MALAQGLLLAGALAPIALMIIMALLAQVRQIRSQTQWKIFQAFASASLVCCCVTSGPHVAGLHHPGIFQITFFNRILAILVMFLGTVIGAFSARYLEGEVNQPRYLSAFSSVLAAVQLLLIADNWLLLIGAWSIVGESMQYLLKFYPDRPFALLAAYKKRIADYLADFALVCAAALAWVTVHSGSLSVLDAYISRHGMPITLQISAVALVIAVVLRTALLPVHGWIIQVMEAPTPVSALLHAGVVNLGGFVLIRFAPMLEHAGCARIILFIFGLLTATLAGLVMLTRVSVKVKLAWSTVSQMGYMLLECALGLYIFAALHLIGHSLYKAQAFLAASSAVRKTYLHDLYEPPAPSTFSLIVSPIAASAVVFLTVKLSTGVPWPMWWSVILGIAWAPLLWSSMNSTRGWTRIASMSARLCVLFGLTASALIIHALPFGIPDHPHTRLGSIAAIAFILLYACQAGVQKNPTAFSGWHRWTYAGFYLDEIYTDLALRLRRLRRMHASVEQLESTPSLALRSDGLR